MADNDQERTEQPTARKLEKARDEGAVVQSQEIPTVVVMATGLAVLALFGSAMWRLLLVVMQDTFNVIPGLNLTTASLTVVLRPLMIDTLLLLAPIVLAVALFGSLSYVGQFGFLVSAKAISPDLNRLNPVSGVARLFSFKAVFDALKGSAKVALIGFVVYLSIRRDLDGYLGLSTLGLSDIAEFFRHSAIAMTVKVIIAFLVIAVIDYLYQRWDFMEKHKMTKQEVKDEFKDIEGDPKVKSRIRRLQVEMAQRRMMAEVPKADVVITNPTHYAVALRYDRGRDLAPMVVAKGKGLVAARIRESAEFHSVPIVERPPLARELYASCKLGQAVPVHLYQAVAEVLAYVYNLNRRSAA